MSIIDEMESLSEDEILARYFGGLTFEAAARKVAEIYGHPSREDRIEDARRRDLEDRCDL